MSTTNEPLDALALFQAQQERAGALKERLVADQARVATLLAPFTTEPEATVALDLDERGLLLGVRIERDVEATADGVRRAFADAAVTARLARPTLPIEAVDAILATGLTTDDQTVTVWDDLRQVSVSALFGDLVALDGTDQWLTSTPTDVMADEILRIGLQAVRRSDRFDRFTSEEGRDRG